MSKAPPRRALVPRIPTSRHQAPGSHIRSTRLSVHRLWPRRETPASASVREVSPRDEAIVDRMKTFNLNSDEWVGTREREGWRAKGALVGQHVGGELIGATMSEVEPGSKLWPYHTHYLNEEWVIVLRGEPTLRTPEGEQVLKEG